MGFFRRPAKGSHIWRNISGIFFETKDERYQWLTEIMGVWEGEFDMESYQHRYQIYGNDLFSSIPEGDISVDDLEILATNLAALIPISSAKLGFVLPRTASVFRAYCCAPHRR